MLLKRRNTISRARETLLRLRLEKIPFILLTNGGGQSESDRVSELSRLLDAPISVPMLVQSHTPFGRLDEYKGQTVLVVGGDGSSCQHIANGSASAMLASADHPSRLTCANPGAGTASSRS